MNSLICHDYVSYDSMIIIYYCFSVKNYELIELNNKAQKLTEFLIRNDSKIIVPRFLISEILNKDILNVIEEYISFGQIANVPPNPNRIFKIGLEFKIKNNFNKLLKKEWFIVEDYVPPEELYNQIKDFYEELESHSRLDEFLKKKNRANPKPSFEDMGLITFSKETGYPIITNDYDITFFGEELYQKGLSWKIFNFNKLEIFNN